jgi:hypothetical protein
MSKNGNKQMKAPVGEQEDVNKLSDDEKMRMATGRQGVLDAGHYMRMPEYRGMKWAWFHRNDGSLDRALDLGMNLTPVRTDRVQRKGLGGEMSEWACKAVGSIEGKTELAYLCHMPADEYKKYFVDPGRARQSEIDTAMGLGVVSDSAKDAGGGLQTYAGKISEGDHNPIR